MAKFNIGDKVTFKVNLEVGGEYGRLIFIERMNKLFGECLTYKRS